MLELVNRNCPLCNSDNYKVLFTDRNRREGIEVKSSYVRCNVCDMIYLNPILNFKKFKEYDQIYFIKKEKVIIDGIIGKINRRIFQPIISGLNKLLYNYNKVFDRSLYFHRIFYNLTNNNARTKNRILDIGCNDANKLKPYYMNGWDVYGVDLSLNAINKAKKNIPKGYFFHGEFSKAGFKRRYFDVIRADHVWEHIEYPFNFIVDCKEILKIGGKLILYIPNGESFNMDFFKKFNINVWIPFHVNMFSEKTATKILLNAGYKKVNIYYNTPTIYLLLSINKLISFIFSKDKFSIYPPDFERILYIILAPFGSFLSKIKKGEELIIIAENS